MSHAEHAHEGALGFLIARCNRPPFFYTGPEALDEVAVLVDPGRTRHRCLVAPGRDGRTRAEAPDQHAEGMRGIAAIGHDPQHHGGEKAQQNRRHRQLMGLSGRQRKADCSPRAVHDDGGLGGEAAARAAQRLTLIPLRGRRPLFGRTGGFLVRPDRAAVEERHPQLEPLALLRQLHQTLPHAMVAPADEGLRRHPPRPQMGRNAAPFGAVLVPPDDRLDGAAEVLVLGLVRRAALLDQRGQVSPLGVGQNPITSFICHGPNIGTDIKG